MKKIITLAGGLAAGIAVAYALVRKVDYKLQIAEFFKFVQLDTSQLQGDDKMVKDATVLRKKFARHLAHEIITNPQLSDNFILKAVLVITFNQPKEAKWWIENQPLLMNTRGQALVDAFVNGEHPGKTFDFYVPWRV